MTGVRLRQRITLLLLAAAAALAALAGGVPAGDAPAVPVQARPEPGARPVERSAAGGATGIEAPGRAFQVRPVPEAQDAFQPRNWLPPAPGPRPTPVARPMAPPLPFAYLGRIEDDGAITVYLRRGEDVILARQKTAIDSAYLLEEVFADRLVFTYVPLQQQQVLSLGAAR